MQLIVVLGVLVAVNFGIVYVGSESLKEEEPAAQGVVEVETLPECEPGTDCATPAEEKPAENQ